MTSNFRRAGKLPNAVAISVGVPAWFRGRRYRKLAPTRAMLKLPAKKYLRRYQLKLKKLDPAKVYEKLGDDAILLCWERPGARCHRRIVAEWFEKALGVEVPEYEGEQSGQQLTLEGA